jgi:hypothetical protein
VPQAQANCWNLRRQHREAMAAGISLGTTSRRRKPTAETYVDNTAEQRPQESALVLRATGAYRGQFQRTIGFKTQNQHFFRRHCLSLHDA